MTGLQVADSSYQFIELLIGIVLGRMESLQVFKEDVFDIVGHGGLSSWCKVGVDGSIFGFGAVGEVGGLHGVECRQSIRTAWRPSPVIAANWQ